MRYGSVCSGIEAATAAWHHMGWEPAFFSEIEAFPRAVLEHHYPEVPLHGDFTTIERNQYGQIDLLVGGTPCQSFSVAGLRGGLDDERGNLALEFCRLAQREQPRWIVWENVPGVLSSSGGRDFGSILGALEDLGYGLAYRVLDAQYFGVAQRRRRVFVVGYLGDWRPAAAVLFERHSMSGHPAPSREARKEAARAALSGAEGRGGCGGDGPAVSWPADVACTLDTDFASKWGQNNQHVNAGCPLFVPDTANAITASLANSATGHNKDENVIAFDAYNQAETEGVSKTVAARNDQDTASCVAFTARDYGADATENVAPTMRSLTKGADGHQSGSHGLAIAYAIMPMNSGKDYKARETEVAQPIMAAGPVGGNQGGDYIVTPFDTTQITSPHNYSSPKEGDCIVQQSERQEQRTIPTHDVVGTLCAEDSPHGARGLTGLQTMLAGYVQPVELVTPFDTTQITSPHNYSSPKEGDPCHPLAAGAHPPAIAFSAKDHGGDATEELSPTLRAGGFTNSHMPAVAAFQPTADCLTAAYGTKWNGNASATNGSLFAEVKSLQTGVRYGEHQQDTLHCEDGVLNTLPGGHNNNAGHYTKTVVGSAVRRLTPVECERLQGFPDNFTAIPWKKKGPEQCPDGPRYKALGNSMAVPVMRWIGERINMIDNLISVL